MERVFDKDFEYTHKNPYDDKLAREGLGIALRDKESEALQGQWRKELNLKDNSILSLEIGSGFGHFLQQYSQSHPSEGFIGLDHRFKRTYQLVKKLKKCEIQNFRYLRARAERLEYLFAEEELDQIFYFFPDPWPKSRHHKKRLIQKSYLPILWSRLKEDGVVFIKTDHPHYFEWMVDIFKDGPFQHELLTRDLYKDYSDHFLASFQTKFEKIFLSQGTKINALVLRKVQKLK